MNDKTKYFKKIYKQKGAVLSGTRLKKLMNIRDSQKRLVVAPLLEPNEQLRNDQASIDIRLGSQFALTFPSAIGEIDEFPFAESKTISDFKNLYKQFYIPIGESFVIHPHQFVLATSLEYVRLPKNLSCTVVGRSTWGRLGLIIATAIGVHPRYAGTLTLEVRNLGETPLRLYPGQSIAQLFFYWVDAAPNHDEDRGQYIASVDLIPRSISRAQTRNKLNALIAQRM